MSVSIKQLKAFVAVVEENSFSLAAERLNATQIRHVYVSAELRIKYWQKTY